MQREDLGNAKEGIESVILLGFLIDNNSVLIIRGNGEGTKNRGRRKKKQISEIRTLESVSDLLNPLNSL
jgi:hypothetical protein